MRCKTAVLSQVFVDEKLSTIGLPIGSLMALRLRGFSTVGDVLNTSEGVVYLASQGFRGVPRDSGCPSTNAENISAIVAAVS